MTRVLHTPQELLGPAMTTGVVLTMVAADTGNKERMPLTGREILFAYNSGGAPYTVTLDGIVDPYGATRSLTAKTVAAGAIKMFGPFDLLAWRQSSGELNFEASNAAVKFGVLRLNKQPVDSAGVLDAGGVVAVAATRTTITPQRVGGSLATDGVVLALTAADVVLYNRLIIAEREFLVAMNSDSGAHNVTLNSVADDHGRTGDVVHALAAGAIAVYGNFDYAWTQLSRYLHLQAADATILLGAVRY